MSFILEALRRAERERSLGQAPRVEDVALAAPPAPRQPRRTPWLIAGALAVLLGVLAWVLLGRREQAPDRAAPVAVSRARPPAPAAAPPSLPAPPAAPAATAAAPAAVPAAASPGSAPAVAADEPLSTLDDLGDPATTVPDYPLAAPEPALAQVQAPPEPAPIAEPEPAPAPDTTPQISRLQLDPPPAPDSAAALATLPRLRDMPPSYRADFPSLTLDVHAWNPDAQRRFVLIGGRRYGEGEALAQGPRLLQIVPQGLVLEYRGERLLYTLEQ